MAIELGRTPWDMFGPGEIVNNYEVYEIRNLWGAFPENTTAWEEAVKKLEECPCPAYYVYTLKCEAARYWFNMLTWLDGKPPTLEAIGNSYGCTRCQSWCVLCLDSSFYFDEDSEGRSHAMMNVDTGLRAQTTQTCYGMPYVSIL